MMRRGKDLPSSSVKGTSRIPKPVSGNDRKVDDRDGFKSRNLRSNSRSTSSTGPRRINRDCLKGVRTDRVVKRTRPFIKKHNCNGGSSATPPTSAPQVPTHPVMKARLPAPRVNTPFQKSVISQTITQSTRVLRSHAASTITSSVQSSKTEFSAVAKLSTTSTPTSTRILRTRASSSRDAATTNIPKFTWNLRRRPSAAKPECKKGNETKPVREHGAAKEPKGATVAKAPEKDVKPCSKQQKQEAPLVKTEQKKSKKVLEVKQPQPEAQPKKVTLVLSKEEKFSKPCLKKFESKTLAVSQGKSLGGAKHKEPANHQGADQLDKHQLTTRKSESKQELDLKKFTITPPLVTKPLVGEEFLEERSVTPDVSEVKISGKDTKGKLNDDGEKIPSVQPVTGHEQALVTKALIEEQSLDERPLTPKDVEVSHLNDTEGKLSQVAETISSVKKTPTPVLSKTFPDETAAHADVEVSEVSRTALAKNVPKKYLLGSTVEPSPSGKGQPSSDEKPAHHVEIPSDTKRKCEEIIVRDDIPVVNSRLEEITSTTSEAVLQNYRGEPSIFVADNTPVKTLTEASNVLKETQTASIKPSKHHFHLRASKLSESPKATIQCAGKRKCEETNVCDNIRAVKSRLECEITLKTSEVISHNCRDIPSIFAANISSIKTPAVVEAIDQLPNARAEKSSERLPAEPTMVEKEQLNPVTTSACLKSQLENGITLKTSEVISQTCKDIPSIIAPDISSVVKTSALGEAIDQLHNAKAEKSLKNQQTTVAKKQLNPVTTSACSKATGDTREQLSDAEKNPALRDKPTLPELERHKSLVSHENTKPLAQSFMGEARTERLHQRRSESTKRRASRPICNNLLIKKRRSFSIENGQHQPCLLPFQASSLQTMDTGITPEVSNHSMEIDTNGILPIIFRFPSAFNTPNQRFGFTCQQTGQPRFGVNQSTGQRFSFGSSLAQNSLQTVLPVSGFNASTFGNVQQLSELTQATKKVQQIFGSAPRNSLLLTAGFNQTDDSKVFGVQPRQNNQKLFGVSFNHPPQTFGNIAKAPPSPAGIPGQSGNHVFGNVSQPAAMFGNLPKAPTLPGGGLNKISNQHFTFGSAPLQTNQSLPVSGVSFNKTNTPQIFASPPALNVRPTLADGSRRKFKCAKGRRRCNVAKPSLNLNQTGNQSRVFGNVCQPSAQHVFSGFSMLQSPTPMESEDGSNLNRNGYLIAGWNNPPSNVWNLFGQKNGGNQVMFGNGCDQTIFGSPQSTTGQHLNDHVMEESVTTPSMMTTISMSPHCTTVSCFTLPIAKTRPQRPLILPPIPPLPGTSAVDRPPSPSLHKIFSSVSSLNSTCSNLSDCQSEKDALIDILSDSVSNCSLEDNGVPNDMGKLVETFKTLSLADKSLDDDAKASEH